jgi:hypothetical protein
LNLFKESVEYNISTLLPKFKVKTVTGAAFSLARYKVEISFFKDLNSILVDFHQRHYVRRWKGFQLIAGDGSTVSLPASPGIKKHFGVYSENENGAKSCLAQLFMLFDINTKTVLASRISEMKNSERTLFKDCLNNLAVDKAIFILDRGFGYFNIFKRLIEQKSDFCIRVSSSNSTFAKQVMNNPSEDFITEWQPSLREKRTCAEHGQDCEPIKVRVSKIKLTTGEIELLISSLEPKNISLADINQLYTFRWGIEEGFKKLKPKMKLEQFGSRKPEGIHQEFEAHIFMMNLVALLGITAQDTIEKNTDKRRYDYIFNWQNAFRFVRNSLIELVMGSKLKTIIKRLIEQISKTVVAVKPTRSFPRIKVRQNKSRLHQTYK